MPKTCDKGADLVVCQHSHIIDCEEEYAGGRIVYAQGNFLLDDVSDENWQAGLMVEVTVRKEERTVRYIPVQTRGHKVIIHPDAELVREAFMERSQRITEGKAVDRLFQIPAMRNYQITW